MQADLLRRYQEELLILKQNLVQFATTHPHLAEFLSHNGEEINDPFINQLLEGIAFLNSRTHIQLADSLNGLHRALLELLAPDFLTPKPSMAILQLIPQTSLKNVVELPADLDLEIDPMSGYHCYFKTCYPIELIPVQVSNVFSNHDVPTLNKKHNAANIVIKLRCLDPEQKFSTLKPKKLRFFLHGKHNIIEMLYQYLFEQVQAISLTAFENSHAHVELDSSALKAVGFTADETLLPTQTDPHLRLLTEYFCFRDKFWFIDIDTAAADIWQHMPNEILLTYHFKQALPTELLNLTAHNFALNAVPIINLFAYTAQAIHINYQRMEYPVVVNEQAKNQMIVYQIKQVVETDAHNKLHLIPKFYSITALQSSSKKRWWTTHSQATDHNANLNIAIVDEQGQPSNEETVITVSTLCCNSNLPHQLAINNQLPALRFSKPPTAISHYTLLTIPSPGQRLLTSRQNQTALLAHVLLKQLDLKDSSAIKQWLDLIFDGYAPLAQQQTTHLRRVIKSLSSKPVLGRLPHLAHNQLCYGTELTIEMASDWPETSYYLFTKVLDQCLVEYSPLNSFHQLNIRNPSGVIKSWPRRSKTNVLY